MTDAATTAPSRWQRAVIERLLPQTPRVISVFLRASLGAHEAGQHVDVRLTAPDGYEAQRSYSIASAPGDESLELAIERLDHGEVSPYFHEVAQPGDAIELRGPVGGHFIWRREDGGPLLLVGGGSGIVPLMAMLRHRAVVARDTKALLIYSARTWDELVYRDELLAEQARDTQFDLVLTTTREARHRRGDFDRRLDRTLLRDILGSWRQTPLHVYVCGSNAFVEAVTTHLVEEIPASSIRTERYGGAD
ncbi:MAG TPA: FAD-binding oxidoreductase [Casimicrobiaceae bacterium]|nr:FAD-binding oxidoreductase [Casimicrobiaceae bacterium]